MKKEFLVLNPNELSTIIGGSRETYCRGQIAGRILRKSLFKQPILPTDFICY